MLPTFEAHEARIEVVLSDNGREVCGRADRHPYEQDERIRLVVVDRKADRTERRKRRGFGLTAAGDAPLSLLIDCGNGYSTYAGAGSWLGSTKGTDLSCRG